MISEATSRGQTGRFDGKVAIVTGGSQGIGEAHVRNLIREGAQVVIADTNWERAAALAQELGSPRSAIAVETDVASPEACRACVAQGLEAYGAIDFLVNNAGLLQTYKMGHLHEIAHEDYLRVLAVNTHGALHMAQAVLPAMRARGGGSIVNTSSVAAWLADGVYAVSKLALNGLTVTLARELAPLAIRVNGVAPGPVLSEGVGSTREAGEANLLAWSEAHRKPTLDFAEPQDIAHLVAFLLSDQARHITGQIIAVDGGAVVRQ
jgi:NAD(P)-dependent dehydrogenase (short-subunit alcohol dehydrogenase family)